MQKFNQLSEQSKDQLINDILSIVVKYGLKIPDTTGSKDLDKITIQKRSYDTDGKMIFIKEQV